MQSIERIRKYAEQRATPVTPQATRRYTDLVFRNLSLAIFRRSSKVKQCCSCLPNISRLALITSRGCMRLSTAVLIMLRAYHDPQHDRIRNRIRWIHHLGYYIQRTLGATLEMVLHDFKQYDNVGRPISTCCQVLIPFRRGLQYFGQSATKSHRIDS